MKTAIVLIACLASALGACPNIVSRAGWGARPPNGISYQSTPVPYVVIHHAESASCSTQSSCSTLVRQFQDQHMDINGWNDIGYSFLVGGDSNAYEGRGWDKVGAHAPGFNDRSIGICFIGSFMTTLPTSGAIATAKQLIQCSVDDGWVINNYSLIGHRQAVSTDCPGDALYNEIKTWNNYDPNP